MSIIVFDALVPADVQPALHQRFSALADSLVEQGYAKRLEVESSAVKLEDDADQQLRAVYEEQHGGDTTDAPAHRFTIKVGENAKSLNETAMTFARLLTPQAELPAEVYALECHDLYEVPDTYPWMVNVHPGGA